MRAPPTPSSLKWLIDRRARLAGELAKLQAYKGRPLTKATRLVANLEKRLEEARHAHSVAVNYRERVIRALSEDLAATDMVLRQHEVQIDPDLISPINGHERKAATDFGAMSRYIFEFLRLSEEKGATSAEVTAYLMTCLNLELPANERSDLRYRVRKRMQYMTWEGKLERIPTPDQHLGRWRLCRTSVI